MKFENPIMEVSMFNVENVVTESATSTTTGVDEARVAANNMIAGLANGSVTVEVIF